MIKIRSCYVISCFSKALVTIYPLAKRVTHWQAVLGSTFNIGVLKLMGYTAALKYNHLGFITFPWMDPSCLSMYLAGISWTLIYDTIYAHQDRDEDTQLGLGSTARRFGENTKYWLTGFSCLTVGSLGMCGILQDMSWPFYAGVLSAAGHFAWQVRTTTFTFKNINVFIFLSCFL
jgi:4-hydroxybenzoate polyprenyltransferase